MMTQGDTKRSRSVKSKPSRKINPLRSARAKHSDKGANKHVDKRTDRHSRKTIRPRSLKVEFDQDFNATANGGAALGEKTMRSLAFRR